MGFSGPLIWVLVPSGGCLQMGHIHVPLVQSNCHKEEYMVILKIMGPFGV